MSPDDRVGTADGTLEDRLRAAGSALREASAAQVDAATGLREILHGARMLADDQALSPAGQSQGVVGGMSLDQSRRRVLRASQRLALVVNLLLVVALSVVLVRVVGNRQEPVSGAPTVTAATTSSQARVPASTVLKTVQVPEECIDATELADEVISRLNRKQRDTALALALRDYSVASQACRREASR